MKNNFNIRIWMVAVMAIFAVVSCTEDENILRGTAADLNEELLISPLKVQIMAAPDELQLPADLSIAVTGPDADAIYGANGNEELTVEVNKSNPRMATLPIGIRRVDPVSADNPVVFTLTLTAEGYNVVTRSFNITDARGETCSIRLLREDSNIKAEGAIMKR